MSAIYMLGDSHTEALGPRLKALLGDGFRYEAFAGYSTARADAARKINPLNAETIFVSLGGNDFGDQSVARSKLVSKLRTGNLLAHIVWVGPFQSNDPTVDKRHLEQARSQQEQFSDLRSGVHWIDGRRLSTMLTHVADGTHFTPASYSALAEEIVSAAGTKTSFGIGFAVVLLGVGWWLLRKLQRGPT